MVKKRPKCTSSNRWCMWSASSKIMMDMASNMWLFIMKKATRAMNPSTVTSPKSALITSFSDGERPWSCARGGGPSRRRRVSGAQRPQWRPGLPGRPAQRRRAHKLVLDFLKEDGEHDEEEDHGDGHLVIQRVVVSMLAVPAMATCSVVVVVVPVVMVAMAPVRIGSTPMDSIGPMGIAMGRARPMVCTRVAWWFPGHDGLLALRVVRSIGAGVLCCTSFFSQHAVTAGGVQGIVRALKVGARSASMRQNGACGARGVVRQHRARCH